jgi:hypothetical protein
MSNSGSLGKDRRGEIRERVGKQRQVKVRGRERLARAREEGRVGEMGKGKRNKSSAKESGE